MSIFLNEKDKRMITNVFLAVIFFGIAGVFASFGVAEILKMYFADETLDIKAINIVSQ